MEDFSFARALQASGISEMNLESGAQRQDELNNFVLLRQLSDDGGFVRTIKCLPGRVTVIASDGEGALEPFRSSLLGEKDSNRLIMRYGARELHSSEVHIATSSSYLWTSKDVKEILQTAGVPDLAQQPLLDLVGLAGSLLTPPNELDAGAMRRLAIVCSFFGKSRLLYYDRPFLNVESRWVNALASFMLEGVEVGSRIVVVTGIQKIPSMWKGNKLVQLEKAEDVSGCETEAELLGYSSLTVGSHSTDERRSSIITRPQLIYPARGAIPEALQAEAIRNPNLTRLVTQQGKEQYKELLDELPQGQAPADSAEKSSREAGSASQRRPPAGMRRSPSGQLTKVTGVYKIKRNPVFSGFKKLMRRLTGSSSSASGESLLVAVKIAESKRIYEQQKLLLILMLLIVFLMLLNW